MDMGAIRELAAGAREELEAEVAARLDAVLAPGSPERLARPAEVGALEAEVAEEGRRAVVERAAYTWFNRLCALRLMDARGYTPAGVVTPREGSSSPAVLADARRGAVDPAWGMAPGVRARVLGLLSGEAPSPDPSQEAYALLLQAACDLYAGPMPFLFRPGLASPLLMPGGLLAEGSVMRRVVAALDEGACAGEEVLGWLYQAWSAPRKDEFFASGRRARPEDLAPATQLFTPGWVVRYLVDNSLGALLWPEGGEPEGLLTHRAAPAPGEGGAPAGPAPGPEGITFVDPACGSGHILLRALDALCDAYEKEGYLPEEAPALALGNNLVGLEIDRRAAELACFALAMRARARDPRFLERGVAAEVVVLEPVRFGEGELSPAAASALAARPGLLGDLAALGEVGSLWAPCEADVAALGAAAGAMAGEPGMLAARGRAKLSRALGAARALSRAYDVVAANPPYMGSGRMGKGLSAWVRGRYPDEKGDLCACFVARGLSMARGGGYVAMVTASSWMFVSSYERMRVKLLAGCRIRSLVQQSTHGFPGVTVPTCMFVLEKGAEPGEGDYVRLEDFDRPQLQEPRALEALRDPSCPWRYRADQRSFAAVPGSPLAYWAGEGTLRAFREGTPLREVAHPSAGITTGDNARFIRCWWEVDLASIEFGAQELSDEEGGTVWYPCNKGGSFRKWYGNREHVMRFDAASRREMKTRPGYRPVNLDRQLKESISWSDVTSGPNSFRQNGPGNLFDHVSISAFPPKEEMDYVNALLNSSVCESMLAILAPTLHCNAGDIAKLPVIAPDGPTRSRVAALVRENVAICREDWDSFETSWGFRRHPLCLPGEPLLERQFARWEGECEARFARLKSNEEELNAVFARAYGMEGEVAVEVPEGKVSARRADAAREARSLVSYGVGCLLGRYSADAEGPVLAGGGGSLADFDARAPQARFRPDADGVLPVLEEEWFEDDAAASLRRWLAATYGRGALEANVAWLEGALGCSLRSYLARSFWADHCAAYQAASSGKRPVYWLVRSPRGGFQALVYAHRWRPTLLAEVLGGYVRPLRDKLTARAGELDASGRPRDRRAAERLRATVRELEDWERDALYPLAQSRPDLDPDDGVRANLARLAGVVAKLP